MKKLALILSTVLCVILFNSCKDKDPEAETNNTTASTELITELKNYTGKTVNEVQPTLEGKGYTFLMDYTENEVTSYIYIDSTYSIMYVLGEAKNLICFAGYSALCNNKDMAYNYFEKYSAECVAIMKGKDHTYKADYESINGEDSTFTNRPNFLSFYNQNKENITSCEEDWITEAEKIESIYESGDVSIMVGIMYMNTALTPPTFYENNKGKNLFNISHIKKLNINKK